MPYQLSRFVRFSAFLAAFSAVGCASDASGARSAGMSTGASGSSLGGNTANNLGTGGTTTRITGGTGGVGSTTGGSSSSVGSSSGGITGVGGTGGTSSVGGTGGMGGAPPPAPGVCNQVFCEDFESGMIRPDIWKTALRSGTVTVQNEIVRSGKFAVKFEVSRAPGDDPLAWTRRHARIDTTATYPTLKDHAWGRAYIHFAPSLPLVHAVIMTAGPFDGRHLESGTYRDPESTDPSGTWELAGDMSHNTFKWEGTVPVNGWTCVEWEMSLTPSISFDWYVDGKLDASYPDIPSGAPEFNVMTFGLTAWQRIEQSPTMMYMDDLALGSTRIGCL